MAANLPGSLLKDEGESLEQYHIRIYSNMDTYEIDKYTAANLVNDAHGTDYDESKWRKDYAQYLKWKPYFIKENLDEDRLAKYEEKRLEQEKEKYRNADQKREYRKMVRESARFDKLKDDVVSSVEKLGKVKPLPFHNQNFINPDSSKHGLALFSDWHYGMDVDNTFNKFNQAIFNERVDKLVSKVIDYGQKNDISTLHIGQLGDLISGDIHVSTRVQANEDLIEQIMYVSEVLAEVINKLASVFPLVKYYNVIGNHARAGKKSEVGLKENFEYLVPWYLESRLKDLDNVEIIVDKDGYIEAQIFNESLVFVHGNFDQADKAVTKLPQLLGYVPTRIIGGHVHHNYMKEHGVTTTHVNGSLIGLDDFATQGRYGGVPSQKFMVFDKTDGLECEYIIKFNNGKTV
ncbi:hypothetical protein [Halobacillus litoralis]|uniref:hypothetical protein n=1 Tax=Halobacillus litoralis TaxID=45668 RepID=UPI001CD1B559|nr:hypothetical protein [Halobacillus litoralis]MCA1021630.1 hypothetical protein [Halobacillus litoralis]